MKPEDIDVVIFATIMSAPLLGIAIASLVALLLDL